ncbi:ATP-binding cassette domain-containing protein [Candidatus Kaiserbacteria bacterium]|nr:ATP-binding cassette domain-containing protein [Candidatus Kaiserbacteria bacterium]
MLQICPVRRLNSDFSEFCYNNPVLNPDNAIEIRGLKKSFKKTVVLKGLDLEVKRGTMLALLGPNGAGKTTTVRILSTLIPPDEGEARVLGFDVVREARRVREVIGLTGQYAAVDEYLTGRENLEMMGRLYHLSREASRRRSSELLGQFDLGEVADRAAKTYSGGLRRRLDLALSLMAKPPVLFLDEPTAGLDPRSRLTMWEIIEKLMDEGSTILLTTQHLEEADKLADRIAVLDRGKIIAAGTADELKAKVGTERIEVIIDRGSNFKKAAEIITGEGKQMDEKERSLSVSTDGSVLEIKKILDGIYSAGIDIESMSVHKPTLDDVFMRLTGREAEEGTET